MFSQLPNSPTSYFLLLTSHFLLTQSPVSAQIIPDNTLGSESSIVTPGQLRDLIEGGAIRGDNLFHSFREFNVNHGQQVYFVNPDSILNIFTRVTGVNPSDIFGTLGVDGGANLVLINPNGIHFGENAVLDVSGSFFATTAHSVVFGNQGEFSATQPEAPPLLTVNITPGLQYGDNPPAELRNEGQISVGGKLVFSGSRVTSTGSLTGNEVIVEAVDGDVQVQDLTAHTATLKAEENLILHSSQLQTTGDLNLLAEDTVIIRDRVSNPFLAKAGGNLHIQGNQAIDILALNHPQTPFQSLGNLTLVSDGNISTDAHFFSGGNLAFVNLAGQPGKVVSLYDPIISADGNVSFGSYTGAALKVEATGDINVTGDVNITTPDLLLNGTAPNDPDIDILTTEPAFILRAGLESLANTPSALPTNAGGSTFTASNPATNPGGITVNGNVSTRNLLGDGGAIIFSAEGDITVNGNLDTTSFLGDSGDISLTTNGEISINDAQITTDTFFANGNAGSITIDAIGQITIDNSSISSNVNPTATGDGGDISINADSATITNSSIATSTALLSDSATVEISINNQLTIDNSSITNSVPELIPGNAGAISLGANNINISNSSTINSDADLGVAGFIDIRARESITITNSDVTAESLGFDDFNTFSDTGAIDIVADTGGITIRASNLSTTSLGTGIAGNIYISAGGDISAAESFIQSDSDAGIAGFIDVIAGENVSIANSLLTAESAGFDFLNLETFGTGGALDITTTNGSIELNNSTLSTTAQGNGFAGSVFLLSGNDLNVLDSDIESNATDGIAGIIDLTATNSLSLNNSQINAQTGVLTETETNGFVGEIGLRGASISLRNSQIDASTSGIRNAGNIELMTTDNNGSITLDASNIESLARLRADGNAGNIDITAGELTSTTNSVISSSTESSGNAGIVTLNIPTISLNNSNINTIAVDDSTGNSGNVEINTSSLSLTQGARIQAQTSGTGNAGTISITATDSISISGTSPFGLNSGLITSSQNEDSGLGGDIIINDPDNPQGTLSISDRGFLSAQTRSSSDGGFIEINVNNLDVQTGGQIITTAAVGSAGKAGDILINATESVNISGVGVEFVQNNNNSDDPTVGTPFENVTVYNLNDLTFITEENANVQNSGNDGTPYVSLSRTATEITSSDGTVLGAADNTVDYYSFGITTADSEGVFDIDNSTNIDTQLFLFNLNTGEFLSSSDDSDISEGAEGSSSTFDSFLEYEFITSGNYVVGVGEFPSSASNGTIVSGEAPDVGDLYTLQVSLENQGVTTVDFESLNPNQGLNSAILGNTQGSGNAGSVTINTGNLNLGEESSVSTATSSTGNGGNINFNATNAVSLTNSSVSASLEAGAMVDNDTGILGEININAPQISILNDSTVTSNVRFNAVGNGGEINLTTDSLTIDSSLVTTSTLGTGNAGSITINSTNDVTLIGNLDGDGDLVQGSIRSEVGSDAVGNAGSIEINTNSLEATDSTISVSTAGEGNAGSLTINSDRVSLVNSRAESVVRGNAQGNAGGIEITSNSLNLDDSILTTDTFGTGNAGSLILDINDTILFENNSRALSQVQTDAVGNAGNIEISTTTLDFRNASFASTSTAGIGDAGIVTINATEANFSGREAGGIPGGVFSTIRQGGVGNAQGITITTESLTVSDGAVIAVDTDGRGNGGTINIATGDLVLDNGDIESEVEVNGNGRAGNINVTAANIFTSNNSEFSSSSEGIGNAGDVNLTVSGTISLDNTVVSSSVDPGARGGAGNVNLNAPQIALNNGTVVTSSVGGIGTAGNVNIAATGTLTFDNSTATSSIEAGGEGTAGFVTINAPQITLQNDSNLTSFTAGIGDAGEVSITAAENLRVEDTTISSDVQSLAEGNAGNVNLNSPQITLTNSALSSDTDGSGNAGGVNLNATSELTVENNSFVSSDVLSTGVGNAGNVTLNSPQITLANSTLSSDTLGEGDAGEVSLNTTNELTVENSQVSSDVFSDAQGNAGNLNLNSPFITLTNSSLSSDTAGVGDAGEVDLEATTEITISGSDIFSNVLETGIGQAGTVSLEAPDITINEESRISSVTFGQGNAGLVNINATEQISFTDSTVGSAILETGVGNAGSISVNAPEITVDTSTLSSETRGQGNAGEVSINAIEELALSNANISSEVQAGAVGNAGSVTLEGNSLTITNNSRITSGSAGEGNAGEVSVNAIGEITVDNADISSEVGVDAVGRAGSVTLEGNFLTISNNSRITSGSAGEGNAGDISFRGNESITINDSGISSATETTAIGNGGSVEATAPRILITNDAFLSSRSRGEGSAGSLTFNSQELTVSDRSQALVSNEAQGNAGNLEVNVNTVILEGNSQLRAETQSGGGGSIALNNLNTLTIEDNSVISASTEDGTAGSIIIDADASVFLGNDSRIQAEATDGGIAGDVEISAEEVILESGSRIVVNSPSGQAGNLTIGTVDLVLDQGTLSANTGGGDGGANIVLLTDNILQMRNESLISANASGTANGGNLVIQTQFIIAEPPTSSEGSDIIANAEFGNGGLVVIFNEGLFGIEFRPERTQFNDITASSRFGAAGIVDIASPNVDPAQSLGALPVDFGDATNLIANSCSAGNGTVAGETSSFIVTGRGGLPPTPDQPLLNNNVFADWVTLEESGESGIGNFSFSNPSPYSPIVEAKGWRITPTGKVILTAEANGSNAENPWLSAYQCKVN